MEKQLNDKLASAKTGLKLLVEAYDAWSAGLGKYSVQAVYAIIAANWAVHINKSSLLSNSYSAISIGLCVFFIVLNILMVWIITELHYFRMTKAMANKSWWQSEWEKRATTRWPYTDLIEKLGFALRIIKGVLPIAAGVFFVLSLF